MQAVRQCSVCAGRVAGGHLWSQVNVSGLQKNAVSRGACIRSQRYILNRADKACSQSHPCRNCMDAVLNPVMFVLQQFRECPV
ncbi:unnamed protein product [Tetraodon nigroviridis]|uniref:(spotted green pufferfish) hypothetical protein n=1 Tax=Tetraodon nigroviridis TaxID=99883 RepID=Q4RZ82_TETNG|nr:unnamed protein product [Tetraodon nigroviridis]